MKKNRKNQLQKKKNQQKKKTRKKKKKKNLQKTKDNTNITTTLTWTTWSLMCVYDLFAWVYTPGTSVYSLIRRTFADCTKFGSVRRKETYEMLKRTKQLRRRARWKKVKLRKTSTQKRRRWSVENSSDSLHLIIDYRVLRTNRTTNVLGFAPAPILLRSKIIRNK